MPMIYQAAQGLPGPHSYVTPTLRLSQSVPARGQEGERTARPLRRVYPAAEAAFQLLKEQNRLRRRQQAERNWKEFGAGVHVVEAMLGSLDNSPRAFTPDDGEEGDGANSGLAAHAMADWSWKPHRDALLSEGAFKTFRGVPPSAAELYGRRSYRPA